MAAGSQKDVLPAGGEIPVLVALGSFVGATICALRINTPASIEATVPSELRTYVDDNWEADNWEQEVARFLLTYLESLRTANKTSATWLVAAIALEILGIASTAVMALLIVQHVS